MNYSDSGGSTALHKACANGKKAAVEVLLSSPSCLHTANSSGNTPLHWASSNGEVDIVKLLVARFEDLDVLAKNSFGKSSLTEGFTSTNTDLVAVLLEHDSATEEKLLSGTPKGSVKIEGEGEEEGSGKEPASTTHVFSLNPTSQKSKTIAIRELAMSNADSPFTSTSHSDTTGLAVWAASVVFGRWVAKLCSSGAFSGAKVLELGGGCGVPGIACAVHGEPREVQITDLTTATLANLQYNINLNKGGYGGKTRVESFRLDWADTATYPEGKVDAVIGADLVYTDDIVPLLLKVLDGVLDSGGSFYYCAPDDGRAGLKTFIEALREKGWEVRREIKAEGEYLENPLASGDDEMCFLCFNELGEKRFVFYEFVKR